ncbi:MAG: LPS export ABC transporter periplasmic protein LptC [Candidatus Omnitrophica bacterium]|nr:LPS export ABC transporter periplasmic protein LptC [Candidatus Omnitrophota bacterium]
MMFKRCLLILALALGLICNSFAENKPAKESDQQISDFSLAGYGDKGKKSWDISGKSADIFDNLIKLKDVTGNMYGEKENINLVADKGDFDKAEGKVHLEENVVITTTGGAKMTTDSLDWDRKKKLVTTEDIVKISRDNMITVAKGATGEPNLNKITLEKDVQVDILPAAEKNPQDKGKDKIIITCDGPLEIDYAKNIATFKNNVKVNTQDNLIYSDIMDVYFVKSGANDNQEPSPAPAAMGAMGANIQKIVARGNVKIVRGENVSYSEEAVYTALDKRIVLTGKPKLIIYSTEGISASFGN